jgi:cytidylate kinase
MGGAKLPEMTDSSGAGTGVSGRGGVVYGGVLIVIDGPAGAGKSTVARRLAEHYGLPVLDTGAIYRALALVARERGVAWNDEAGLAALTTDFPIRFVAAGKGPPSGSSSPGGTSARRSGRRRSPTGPRRCRCCRRCVAGCSGSSAALGASGCVAEGRDLGTVVFPDAPFKFFLTADDRVRAARRQLDLTPRRERLPARLPGARRGPRRGPRRRPRWRPRRRSRRCSATCRAATSAIRPARRRRWSRRRTRW